jgi:hypothetical protein
MKMILLLKKKGKMRKKENKQSELDQMMRVIKMKRKKDVVKIFILIFIKGNLSYIITQENKGKLINLNDIINKISNDKLDYYIL